MGAGSRIGGRNMILTVLVIYIGVRIGVPVWFYVACGVLMVIQAAKLGCAIRNFIQKVKNKQRNV